MTIRNMAKLNMANINTLFRKVYLLAGVIMAANMFVVNEMEASDTTLTTNIQEGKREPEEENNTDKFFLYTDDIEQEDNDEKAPGAQPKSNILDKLLSHENAFNLFGGLAFSGFINNYLKLWNYDAGSYWKLGCLGYRTKKLFDIVQFEGNLNLGRGAIWLIATFFGSYEYIKGTKDKKELTNTAGLITMKILNKDEKNEWKNSKGSFCVFYFIFSSLQGFISLPLTFHISNFSISISLDSMIWGVIGFFLDKKDEEEKGGEERKNNGPNNGGNAENNEGDNKNENEENIENNNLDDSSQRITTTF